MMRHAIGTLFNNLPFVLEVESAESFNEFLIKLKQDKTPKLVSMEIETNTLKNIQQLKKKYPSVLIFIISEKPAKDIAHVMLSAGANCYIEKTTPSKIIKNQFEKFISFICVPDKQFKSHLTKRQIQLLNLIELAFSNQEIAEHLNLKLTTIRVHLNRLYKSIGVRNRIQALCYARNRGFL